ncbi:hypothetical protein GCM10025780_07810 [Frondihabitans cladoniiphilus]|uniref:Uncharacterized protein n=1 Tax=Frondihabitans cladoniiphilus TaxID=715785 RepID=A0ABP8VMV3_9MICO
MFEPKNGVDTALELFGYDGEWFLFAGGIVRIEPDHSNSSDADLEAKTVAWALATGGAGRYRLGFRRRWILGDHAAIARRLRPGREPRLLESRSPWDTSGLLVVPPELTPLQDRFCIQ